MTAIDPRFLRRHPRDFVGRWRDRCRVAQWTADALDARDELRRLHRSTLKAIVAMDTLVRVCDGANIG